jgi:hypothetical protein
VEAIEMPSLHGETGKQCETKYILHPIASKIAGILLSKSPGI